MKKSLLILVLLFSLVICTCSCGDLTKDHGKYYGTEESEKRWEEIQKEAEEYIREDK